MRKTNTPAETAATEPEVPVTPPLPDGDPVARRRDAKGNRLGNSWVYHFPYPGDKPAEQTHLKPVFEEIGVKRPAWAAYLEYFYDELVRGALERYREARDTSECRRLEWNEEAVATRERIEKAQARLRKEAHTLAQPYLKRLRELAKELETADQVAAENAGAAGLVYDPDQELDAMLLPHRQGLEYYAAELQVPDPGVDVKARLPEWLVWVATVLMGAFFGTSIGLIAGTLAADELPRQLATTAVFAAVGSAPAVYLRKAVYFAHRQASERGYLELSWTRRAAFAALALGFDVLVLAVDVVVERMGLLKVADAAAGIQALAGASASRSSDDWLTFFPPLLITLGYVAYAAWEGYLAGRNSPISNRLIRAQHQAEQTQREAQLARPEVREAVAAYLAVHRVRRAIGEQERQADEAVKLVAAEIARLETERMELHFELTPEQQLDVQDAHDNLLGADAEFNNRLRNELEEIEPSSLRAFSTATPPSLKGRLRPLKGK